MIAVDTNILVYAHRSDSPWHQIALTRLGEVAEGAWAIPWPCIHEFVAIVSHPKIFDPPTPQADAIQTVTLWMEAPTLTLLSEIDGYWTVLAEILTTSHVVGPRVHDARIAALCVHHGVREIWSADRDFGRFSLKATNPLVESTVS